MSKRLVSTNEQIELYRKLTDEQRAAIRAAMERQWNSSHLVNAGRPAMWITPDKFPSTHSGYCLPGEREEDKCG